ncbi:MAG: hypothetical protein Q8M26_16165 [Pseudolabrys sp.]|nr:hypothetical protein [Pseudolabrys sp.]
MKKPRSRRRQANKKAGKQKTTGHFMTESHGPLTELIEPSVTTAHYYSDVTGLVRFDLAAALCR